jgi:hypothetical protein
MIATTGCLMRTLRGSAWRKGGRRDAAVNERCRREARQSEQCHAATVWVPAQHDSEEMESLLGESSVASLEIIGTGNFSMEKRIILCKGCWSPEAS